jgi:hypothetical protein
MSDLGDALTRRKEQIRKHQRLIDLKWHGVEVLDRMLSKGVIPEEYYNFTKEVYNIAEEIFTPERVDIQYDLEPHFSIHRNTYGSNHAIEHLIFKGFRATNFRIITHFPQFVIKDAESRELTIKDFYTSTQISYANKYFGKPDGNRLTYSIPEFKQGYVHSHLNVRLLRRHENRVTYTDFCWGESDIVAALSLVNSEHDPDQLRLFFLQLESFLAYENSEGVPHIKIKTVMSGEASLDSVSDNDLSIFYTTFIVRLRHKVRNTNYNLNVDWKYNNGRYEIIDNEKLETLLRDILYGDYVSFFYLKDTAGNYTKEVRLNRQDIITMPEDWIPFKGEKRFFKVEGELESLNRQAIYYIHPKVKRYVKSKLEHTANYNKIRQLAITRASRGSYV